MTSKEKAFELSLKYQKLLFVNIWEENEDYIHEDSVKCAKICVQEIIEALTTSTGHLLINQVDEYELVKDFKYWQEVLNHLNEM